MTLSALDHILDVMRDPLAAPARRDAAAKVLAHFARRQHPGGGRGSDSGASGARIMENVGAAAAGTLAQLLAGAD